jgi:hypothetical protein
MPAAALGGAQESVDKFEQRPQTRGRPATKKPNEQIPKKDEQPLKKTNGGPPSKKVKMSEEAEGAKPDEVNIFLPLPFTHSVQFPADIPFPLTILIAHKT